MVSIGGGRVIAITGGKPAPDSPMKGTITVRTEIVGQAEALQAAALSETQEMEIDCAAARAKAGPMSQFAGRDLTGAVRVRPGWASWSSAPASTTLGRIIEAACNPAFRGVFVVAGLTQGAPNPAGPAAAAPSARAAPPPSARAAVAKPTPTPPAAKPAPKPAAPKPAAPEAKAKPAPAPVPAAQAELGRHLVQIGASRKREEAQATLAAYRKRHPDRMKGRPATVEETTVVEQTFYRVLIGGFATTADASAFCDMHKSTGGDCLLRER